MGRAPPAVPGLRGRRCRSSGEPRQSAAATPLLGPGALRRPVVIESFPPPAGRRLLAVAPEVLEARESIERHLDHLNRAAPAARRAVLGTGGGGCDRLSLSGVASPLPGARRDTPAIVEVETDVGLEVLTRDRDAAAQTYSCLVPLRGRVGAKLRRQEVAVGAGEALIIDPSEVERTLVGAGTHFVEFDLPKTFALALGAELAPGAVAGVPHFAPQLRPELTARLLFMIVQAAHAVVRPGASTLDAHAGFRRWSEMIAMALLQEQPVAETRSALASGPSPASVRRALEFIAAHANREIVLSDIAAAACVSARSLLRHFNDHVGLSPGAFLRQVRLDRARDELRRGDVASVRDVARRWGFENASKFSRAYQRRFGERPSETRW